MASWIQGIHHVTGAAVDPQEDYDFYTKVLGLRLVKRTVNHENPTMWHFFYGDHDGHAGTVMTNFLFKGVPVPPCRRGRGSITEVSYSVPRGSVEFWRDRLAAAGARPRERPPRFGERVLYFEDPASIPSEMIECDDDRDPPALAQRMAEPIASPGRREAAPSVARPILGRAPLAGIEPRHAVRGFHSVALLSRIPELTLDFFHALLRFEVAGRDGDRTRLGVGGGGPGRWVDLVEPAARAPWASFGIGSIHHVAFTVASVEQMQRLWQSLSGTGLILTDLRDRKWFHSMYLTEPGGINVEISNLDPGFTVDESIGHLGTSLMLPRQWEPRRAEIERGLPPLAF